ncbi:TonB-system energizer ExbB [Nitratifractor salsuginis]|uniref:Outer membrane transport energization protein ExbB n=1 Tax=Nitratifractor salsuginis (strain DSM 16511 / JCM 12458 / E9I37-1) TaxID=749222 RepID=E6X0Q8_NITSE|nr:TonB-system energizer ExbB [Nitratifractor salsuginis]ADV45778.1 outer membrane transport energization protein ExbB [Nitratifractor salsuginis DSM 16511]
MNIHWIKEIVDYGILGTLALMGFIALWVYFERLIFFRKIDLASYRHKEALETDLTANTTILSSIGSSAPYIGLLGTVLGIIITFYLLGQTKQMDAGSIMTSLSLALKATAMGLVVAIPSMLFYNHVVRKIEVLQNRWEILHDHGD